VLDLPLWAYTVRLSNCLGGPGCESRCLKKSYAGQLASHNGNTDTVELLLLDSCVNSDSDTEYTVQFASDYGHTDTVELLLLNPCVNSDADTDYAVGFASEYGHTDTVESLLLHPRTPGRP
jgi:ankyrin repeat protein